MAFSLSAEETANLTTHLEGEVHAKLLTLSQESVAQIMRHVSEDLFNQNDELRDELLSAARAMLASELGKLAAEAHTLAAGKLEEKVQVSSIGTKLARKQLDIAVREARSQSSVLYPCSV